MRYFGSKQWGSRIVFFALLATVGVLFCMAFNSAQTAQTQPQPQAQNKIYQKIILNTSSGQNLDFYVEIADTPLKSAKGLMFRTQLAEKQGMLFIAPDDQVWTMWMKNTYIPLDMLFFNRNGEIVKIIKNARPHDLTRLSSGKPVAGVLEIGGGVSDKYNINVGDFLLIH